MKFKQLKQYLTLVDEEVDNVSYDVSDGYVLKVRPEHYDNYYLVTNGLMVFPGGIDPDYEDTDIKFFYVDDDTDNGDASFVGSVEDEIECDVEVYKRLD